MGLSFAVNAAAIQAFGFADVARRARALAAESYETPRDTLPAELRQLGYDDYRRIRSDPAQALWAGAGTVFEVSYFHPGMNYAHPVRINEVSAHGVREIRFDPADFEYGHLNLDREKIKAAEGLGFAGFRVHAAADNGKPEEILSFHGASLFRSPGDDGVYGAWARGLAIDTALPSGEEFPRFVEFWIERPARTERHLVIHALLDSPRLTGAYRFVIRPGETPVQEVKARLYPRAGVGKLGVAPIASMHFAGENAPPRVDDFRPEIHDSDGLSIHGVRDQWIWRPLVNPRRLLVTSFAMENPVGFGLIQRDRAFASYQDAEARRELRPSVWIQPAGLWGTGRVELVQIPTPTEFNNNIVAYWVPERPLEQGKRYDFEYRVSWPTTATPLPAQAWVAQTRRGNDAKAEGDNDLWLRVDFVDPAFAAALPDRPVRAQVSADDNGELVETRLSPNPALEGWRLTLRLRRRDATRPVELRAQLFDRDVQTTTSPRSELWSYILPAD